MQQTTEPTAYGYLDNQGSVRGLTVSRADAIRNARLNGRTTVVHVRCTDRGTVPAHGAVILRTEEV